MASGGRRFVFPDTPVVSGVLLGVVSCCVLIRPSFWTLGCFYRLRLMDARVQWSAERLGSGGSCAFEVVSDEELRRVRLDSWNR